MTPVDPNQPNVAMMLDIETLSLSPQAHVTQIGVSQIRTWWPVQWCPPGTRYVLTLTGLCGQAVIRDTWTWQVVASPDSLVALLSYLHTAELGRTEAPCIADEATYEALRAYSDDLVNAVSDGDRIAAEDAIMALQAVIVAGTVFSDHLADGDRTPRTNTTIPAIVDTYESPCSTKMLSDLVWIWQHLA